MTGIAAVAGEEPGADGLAAGRHLFAQPCTFVRGIAGLEQLPDAALPEVAFAGRSNVGKSSLINALTNRGQLARTSNTPGRTQQINFFDLGGRLMLVDLPGYGFAEAPKKTALAWQRLVVAYLRGRSVLRRAMVLVDSRHGLKDSDRTFLGMLGEAAVSFQIVLTKADLIGRAARDDLEADLGRQLGTMPAAHPRTIATSARKGEGIDLLRAELATLEEGGLAS